MCLASGHLPVGAGSASFRTLFVLLVVDVTDLYSGYRLLRPPNFKVSVKPTGFGSSSAKETHKGALTPSGTPRKQPPGSGFKAPLPPGSPPKSAKVQCYRWGVVLGNCDRCDPRIRTAILHDADAVLLCWQLLFTGSPTLSPPM
jgi:hypothetical protein